MIILIFFTEGSQQPNGPNASRFVESLLGARVDHIHVEQFATAIGVLPPTRFTHSIQQVSDNIA